MFSTPFAARVFIERSTGRIVQSAGNIFEEDWPYRDVHQEQPLIRYMDLFKLEDLLKKKALYFRRADKFEDSLEGTLSREGVDGTSRSDRSFFESVNINQKSYEERAAYRKISNGVHFVNCWHINDRLNPMMWDAYTKSPSSVAVLTSRRQLERSIGRRPILMSAVRYVDDDTPRTDFGDKSLLLYKDKSFAFEQEFRLIASMADFGDDRIIHENPDDFFRCVPVEISTLIQGIAFHPYAIGSIARKIETVIKEHAPFLTDHNFSSLLKILNR